MRVGELPQRDGRVRDAQAVPEMPARGDSMRASQTWRVGRVKVTVWPKSLPWLVQIGRRQFWVFDSKKRQDRDAAA